MGERVRADVDGPQADSGDAAAGGSVGEEASATAAAPARLIVMKKDGGGQTGEMDQSRAQSYLINVLREAGMTNKESNLKQALNDIFSGKDKATGSYTFNDQPVRHASSGNGQKSCTLFCYANSNIAMLFAMGEHVSGPGTRYEISVYGQKGTDFAKGKTIAI